MRTTIDAAGRIVVPKSIREATGLHSGQEGDIVFTNGHIEMELAPADVRVDTGDGLPTALLLTRGRRARATYDALGARYRLT